MLRNPNEYHNRSRLLALGVCPVSPSVTEVVQTLQLCTDRDELDVVGDLSVCLDGMTVDPETFATAEANHQGECPGPKTVLERSGVSRVDLAEAQL